MLWADVAGSTNTLEMSYFTIQSALQKFVAQYVSLAEGAERKLFWVARRVLSFVFVKELRF